MGAPRLARSGLVLFGLFVCITASAQESGPPPRGEATTPERTAVPPAPSGTPAERQAWLRARIDELLGAGSLRGAKIGVAVIEVDTGRVLYARNEKSALNPASNAKLVTTAAALALLGPEYRFKTAFYADDIQSGAVIGNLYIKGFGDPSFVTPDLWKMVSDLYAQGIRRVSGDLIVDDTFFDQARLPPAFDQKQEDAAYRAPSGAASLNYNSIAVTISPAAQDGAPARVVIEPPSTYVIVESRARTTSSGQPGLSVVASARGEQTVLTITGRILRGGDPRTYHRRISHPDLYLGATLRELLTRRGIKIGGKGPYPGATPAGARPLVGHASEPLSVLIREINKRSNNFMAEQVLKTLGAESGGRPGTWQKGLDAIAKYLDELGVPRLSYQMVNGSGLYDADRFSPQVIVHVLRQAYRDFRVSADYVASLAVAGADGTVSHRMEGSAAERYVRAKTGTLDGVSCLSGFAGAATRPPIAFSILMNDLAGDASGDARRTQDAIAELLVSFLESTPAAPAR